MAVPTDLAAPLDHPVALACRLNYVEFCHELGRWSGARGAVLERDGLMLWGTASDFPVSLKCVLRLDPTTRADQVIAVADEWFGARGTGYTVNVVEPHIETVLALLDGHPVACAQLLLSHGMGGVYYVGTLEAARGRGLGELVTAAVTNRGFERGAASVGLQASPMGEAIYRRMGYRDLYRQAALVRLEAPTA